MAQQKFEITARCEHAGCPTNQFTRLKNKATYMGSDDREHPFDRLVCPDCGLLGFVSAIRSLPEKAVA